MVKNRRRFNSDWDEIDYLYHKLLYWFYGPAHNRSRARHFAGRLERVLRRAKSSHEAIFGEECWSLVFEVKGNLKRAIKHRQNEIRLMKTLFSLPGTSEFSKKFPGTLRDHSDLADRLGLLAILQNEAGDRKASVDSLTEARQLARTHAFRFEWGDLLRKYARHGR